VVGLAADYVVVGSRLEVCGGGVCMYGEAVTVWGLGSVLVWGRKEGRSDVVRLEDRCQHDDLSEVETRHNCRYLVYESRRCRRPC